MFMYESRRIVNTVFMETVGQRMRRRAVELGIRDVEVARRAKISPRRYSHYVNDQRQPDYDTLVAICAALDCTPDYLFGFSGEAKGRPRVQALTPIDDVEVRGAAAEGEWTESPLWPEDRRYGVPVPRDGRFGDAERYGLELRDASMNNRYEEGAILICVDFDELGRGPTDGERVICRRQRADGRYETLVRLFVVDENGHAWLWPRSSHPSYQAPLRAPDYDRPVIFRHAAEAPAVGLGEPVVTVVALVVGGFGFETIREHGGPFRA